MIQSWVDNGGISLLMVPRDAYVGGSGQSYKGVEIGADGPGSPGNLVLSFEALVGPACGDYDHANPEGDLNDDCEVNFGDFVILTGSWAEDTAPE